MMSHETIKLVGDGASVVTTVAALAGWLPVLAALASLIWTCLRIFESRTVQNWLHRHDPYWTPIKHKDAEE